MALPEVLPLRPVAPTRWHLLLVPPQQMKQQAKQRSGCCLRALLPAPQAVAHVCEFGFEERQPDKQARLSIAISPRARRIGAPFTQQVF